MFPSEVEAHYTTHRHPKGGNSPLRYKLALYNYVERQKEQRESIPVTGDLFIIRAMLGKIFSAGSGLLNWINSQSPTVKGPFN